MLSAFSFSSVLVLDLFQRRPRLKTMLRGFSISVKTLVLIASIDCGLLFMADVS
jgi:hypothetical protein